MNRLVYLYELDSVRNSDKEIERAEKALCEQIVVQGDTVVLSFNQLTDSDGFLHFLKQDDTYQWILELFRSGALKVSRFGKYRTPSQYVQGAIETCLEDTTEGNSKFLFSGIPVKSTDKELLRSMLNALRYNALDFMYEEQERFEALYEEAKNTEEVAIIQRMKRKLDNFPFLIRYVNLLIRMSLETLACNPPKTGEKHNFTYYMDKMLALDYKSVAETEGIADVDFVSFAEEAVIILKEMYNRYDEKNREKRSVWIDDINKEYKAEYDIIRSSPSMAIAMIDMCYNYTIEDSILNVSKRYDDSVEGDFERDYIHNLYGYWDDIVEEIHKLTKDNDTSKKNAKVTMPLETTAGVVQSISREENPELGVITKENQEREKQLWKKKITWNVTRNIFFAIMYILLFVIIQMLMGKLENWVMGFVELPGVISDILSIVVFGIIGSKVDEKTNVPDITASFTNIKKNRQYAKEVSEIRKGTWGKK